MALTSDMAAVKAAVEGLVHLKGFTKGLLSSKDIVYYASFIFLANYLAHRVVESQRWN